jgi:acetyltransferase-like isoleucine patch superfamily enzyme
VEAANLSGSIHPTAIVETQSLGAGCAVHAHASLGAEVSLDADVTVGSGARLLGETDVGAGVAIGPNAVLGHLGGAPAGRTIVGRGAHIGANATVLASVTIGRGAIVEPGSVVAGDVPAHAIVRGSPARIVGYVDTPAMAEAEIVEPVPVRAPTPTGVPGVALYPLTNATDLRGSLAALELETLPFLPRRVFAVHGVPDESVRGAHAHKACGQVLVCMSGEVSSVADDGTARQEFRLTGPEVGLYIPPLIWSMQYRYTADAVLVVLAELPYDPDDYIRDYEEFLELVRERG